MASPLDTAREVLTPEGVALRLLAAGPFPRALAWLIDLAIRLTLLLLATLLFGLLGRLGNGLALLLAFALTWAYPVLFEALCNGQTPGKRALDLRVVAGNGTPVGWMAAFARNLLRVVDLLPAGYATGLVASLFDPWGRRLGDVVAGTLVVHVVRAPVVGAIAAVPARPAALPLRPDEQDAVIAFAERARTLAPQRQQELAELARPVTGTGGNDGVSGLFAVANWLLGALPASASAPEAAPGSRA